jgi:putative tryptophan/tyrosine transport system substrate-binding protein
MTTKEEQMGKKLFYAILLAGFLMLVIFPSAPATAQEKISIGVLLQSEGPFKESSLHIEKTLSEEGFNASRVEYVRISVENKIENVKDAVAAFRKANVKLIIVYGTNAVVETLKMVRDIPVIWSFLVSADLAKESRRKFNLGDNFTGVVVLPFTDNLLKLGLKIKPIKHVGMLSNEREENAKKHIEGIVKTCEVFKIKTTVLPYGREEDATGAFAKLCSMKGIDAVIFPRDTMQVKKMKDFLPIIRKNNMFTMGSDASFSQDSVVSLSNSSRHLGWETGRVAAKILKGAKPADIPIASVSQFDVIANVKLAKEVNVGIPVEVLQGASKIIKD